MKDQEDRIFLGGMNLDDSEYILKENEYREARNVKLFTAGNDLDGEIQNYGSTIDVFTNAYPTYTPPSGTNKIIGEYSDTVKNRIYFFLYNSNGNHQIVFYNLYAYTDPLFGLLGANTFYIPSVEITGTTTGILNFTSDMRIHSIDIMRLSNGLDLLCWCQPNKSPRELNVSQGLIWYQNIGSLNTSWDDAIDDWLSDAKRIPTRPPIPSKDTGTTLEKSYMGMFNDGTNFNKFGFDGCQFITRYVYNTGAVSMWSGCSPYFPVRLTESDKLNGYITNGIYLDLRDPSLFSSFSLGINTIGAGPSYTPTITSDTFGTFNPSYFEIIKYVDIAYREDYRSSWKFIERIPFVAGSYFDTATAYVFKAGGNYIALSNEEVAQAWSNVPLKAETIKIVKNKKIYGNIVENYDYDATVLSKLSNIQQKTSNYATAPTSLLGDGRASKCYKGNSLYNFGLEFFDAYGRVSSIYTNNLLTLQTGKFTYANAVTYGLSIDVDNTIFTTLKDYSTNPSGNNWVVGFRLKRSANKTTDFYCQGLVNAVQYVRGYVKDNIKNYSVINATTGELTKRGLNWLDFGSNVPRNILVGDTVTGNYQNPAATYFSVPDGTIVVELAYDTTSLVYKARLNKPLSNAMGTSQSLSFQSVGINPATYINNQNNQNTSSEFTTSVSVSNSSPSTSTTNPFGISSTNTNKTNPFGVASTNNNNTNSFGVPNNIPNNINTTIINPQAIAANDAASVSEKYKNADFQIGNPIYMHNRWYPTGAGIGTDIYNDSTSLGFYGTSSSDFDCTELHVDISNWFSDTEGSPYIFKDGDTLTFKTYTDNVHSILNVESLASGNYNTYKALYNLKIKQQRGNFLIVDCPKSYNPFAIGAFNNVYFNSYNLIEINRPKSLENQLLYYDIGQTFHKNSITGNNITIGKVFGSINHAESGDTLFSLGDGDSYYFRKETKIMPNDSNLSTVAGLNINYYLQNISPTAEHITNYWVRDWGRPNIVFQDKDKQLSRTQTIRYSLPYIQTTTLNNTNNFPSQNQLDIPIDCGKIRRIEFGKNTLVIFCEREAVTAYVDENLITTAEGKDQLTVSNSAINNPRKLEGQYGCLHPESVYNYGNKLYWYSAPKGSFCRYSDYAGVDNINDKVSTYAYQRRQTTYRVEGGFDPQNNSVVFGFEAYGSLTGAYASRPESIIYSEDINKWVSFADFFPDCYAHLNTDWYSFKNGRMYLHNGTVSYGNAYGNALTASIIVPFNKDNNLIKNFLELKTQSNVLWTAPAVDCVHAFASGLQQTRMNSDRWEKWNEEYWTPVMCDLNTVNATDAVTALNTGDPLIGRVLRVKLANSLTTLAKLFKAKLIYFINQRTT